MDNNTQGDGYGLGTILGGIVHELQSLIRGEIRLARAELDQKLHTIIIAAIFLLGGALLAFAGLVVFLQGIAAALALVLPTWVASLLVGILIVAVGGLFAWSALRRFSLKTLNPERMTASLRKDANVLREHI